MPQMINSGLKIPEELREKAHEFDINISKLSRIALEKEVRRMEILTGAETENYWKQLTDIDNQISELMEERRRIMKMLYPK